MQNNQPYSPNLSLRQLRSYIITIYMQSQFYTSWNYITFVTCTVSEPITISAILMQ